MDPIYDLLCIGAGPTGLACAIEAKRAGMRPLVVDKGCLCNSLYHYPMNMKFFTTSERMEIGDLPMTVGGDTPTRMDALKYYRKTVEHFDIELLLYSQVTGIDGADGAFRVFTHSAAGEKIMHARKLAVATGYYDRPNPLNVPGENLPFVSHYFTDPHPFWRQDVVVIGAKNSAAEAALDLFRGGANVTLVHRGATVGKSLKYWVKPDIENRISAGEIRAMFNTEVVRFESGLVHLINSQGGHILPAAKVFAMTGYHPDFSFLEKLGIHLDAVTRRPTCDPQSLESNVPGLYVAGVVVGGLFTGEIFIENGRFHGKQIISHLTGKHDPLGPAPVSPPGE
jgi:thioredoxin reductase (NADPH)